MRKRLVTAVVVALLSGLLTGGVAEAGRAVLDPRLTATTVGGISAEFSVDPGPSAGAIESITYDFGAGLPRTVDGNVSVENRYLNPGTYEASAEVVDVDGNRATATTTYTTAGSGYVAYGPSRFLDTRTGNGAPPRKLAARGSLDLKVSGRNGIPPEATAVAVNVTVTNATAAGWVVAYPWGQPRPTSSIVDYTARTTASNATIVGIANADLNSNWLTVYNGGGASVDVIIDVTGYFIKSGSYNGLQALVTPTRLLDTRAGTAPVPAGHTLDLNVATDNAPFRPTAVVLNVTAVDPATTGHVTTFPAGTAAPTASSLNFTAGENVANLVVVPVTYIDNEHSTISFHTNATTHLVVDVTGYFGGASGYFVPINPSRKIDTRRDFGLSGPLAPRSTTKYNLGTVAPANLGLPYGVIASAKVVNATQPGYLRVTPIDSYNPRTSLLNFTPGTVTGNFFALWQSGGPFFHVGSVGTADLVVDAFGYFYDD